MSIFEKLKNLFTGNASMHELLEAEKKAILADAEPGQAIVVNEEGTDLVFGAGGGGGDVVIIPLTTSSPRSTYRLPDGITGQTLIDMCLQGKIVKCTYDDFGVTRYALISGYQVFEESEYNSVFVEFHFTGQPSTSEVSVSGDSRYISFD